MAKLVLPPWPLSQQRQRKLDVVVELVWPQLQGSSPSVEEAPLHSSSDGMDQLLSSIPRELGVIARLIELSVVLGHLLPFLVHFKVHRFDNLDFIVVVEVHHSVTPARWKWLILLRRESPWDASAAEHHHPIGTTDSAGLTIVPLSRPMADPSTFLA